MKISARHQVFGLLFSLLFCSVGVVWVRTSTVKATYEFVRQEREVKRLQDDLQGLRLRWLRLTSPAKLQTLAQLHQMAPPKIEQVIKINGPKK